MKLTTERLKLREVLPTDSEKIHELHSFPETDRYNTSGIPETMDVTRQLVAGWVGAQSELPRKKIVFFTENSEEEFIGLIAITMGKPAYRNAEISYKIHPAHWSRGFATEMVHGILRFCFSDLKLHRIEAGCAVENLASKRVLEKAGMLQEGLCRKILPIRGEWSDNFEFAILDTDFEALSANVRL